MKDAEAESLRRLSEIRAVIAGEVRDAEGHAVRAALARTFEHFVIRRHTARIHVELVADAQLVIEPVIREHLRPILRRQPLGASPHGVREEPPISGLSRSYSVPNPAK